MDKVLNKPFYLPKGSGKKFGVYVKRNGRVLKVTFGDPGMDIKRDSPERRAAFRSRQTFSIAERLQKEIWSLCQGQEWECD